MNLKFYKLVISAIILVIIIGGTSLLKQESEYAKKQRLYYFSILNLKRIGVALLEYSEKEGNGTDFPPDLQTLIDKKYIKDKNSIFSVPPEKKTYYYFKNVKRGMPKSIPILMEPVRTHMIHGEKGAFVLNSHFSITYIVTDPKDYIKSTENILQTIKKANKNDLIYILENGNSNDFVRNSLALWKMDQKNTMILLLINI